MREAPSGDVNSPNTYILYQWFLGLTITIIEILLFSGRPRGILRVFTDG